MKRQKQNKKIILGLTGGMSSGKTTVARIFRSLGARTIDADAIAHSLIKPDTKIYRRIIKAFGRGILKKDRGINRRKLGRIVFGDNASRLRLNRIMHPEIIKVIRKKLAQVHSGTVILEAPLLIEAGATGLADKLVVVNASFTNQIKRIRKKSALIRDEIVKRIKSQMPLEKKVRLADFVIDNNGSLEKTRKQAAKLWRRLWKN
jgi:dephospho-CoA kinase